MDTETLINRLGALAEHLTKVSESSRAHGGHGWTYDDEIETLNAAIAALANK